MNSALKLQHFLHQLEGCEQFGVVLDRLVGVCYHTDKLQYPSGPSQIIFEYPCSILTRQELSPKGLVGVDCPCMAVYIVFYSNKCVCVNPYERSRLT